MLKISLLIGHPIHRAKNLFDIPHEELPMHFNEGFDYIINWRLKIGK